MTVTRSDRMLERAPAAYNDRVGRIPYTLEEVEFYLFTVAVQHGNAASAARILKNNRPPGFKSITAQTLQRWVAGMFADRYNQIVEERMPEIQRQAATRLMALVEKAAVATELAVDKTETALKKDAIEPRDLGPTARSLSQVHANTHQQQRLMQERPTEIKDFNMREVVDELKELLGTKPAPTIDAEAIEE
jgi:hypothetical protein